MYLMICKLCHLTLTAQNLQLSEILRLPKIIQLRDFSLSTAEAKISKLGCERDPFQNIKSTHRGNPDF